MSVTRYGNFNIQKPLQNKTCNVRNTLRTLQVLFCNVRNVLRTLQNKNYSVSVMSVTCYGMLRKCYGHYAPCMYMHAIHAFLPQPSQKCSHAFSGWKRTIQFLFQQNWSIFVDFTSILSLCYGHYNVTTPLKNHAF